MDVLFIMIILWVVRIGGIEGMCGCGNWIKCIVYWFYWCMIIIFCKLDFSLFFILLVMFYMFCVWDERLWLFCWIK